MIGHLKVEIDKIHRTGQEVDFTKITALTTSINQESHKKNISSSHFKEFEKLSTHIPYIPQINLSPTEKWLFLKTQIQKFREQVLKLHISGMHQHYVKILYDEADALFVNRDTLRRPPHKRERVRYQYRICSQGCRHLPGR